MSDLDVSDLLRNLSDDYSNNRVSFSEYRLQRRIILRSLDEEYNQVYFEEDSEKYHEADIDKDDAGDEVALVQELEK